METRFENERVSGPAGFRLSAPFAPMGDQPEAIDAVCRGFEQGAAREILQGVTGSGKTFTMANVIARLRKPTLVISHNKTLAAQLYAELKGFFPDNAVEYFISYYDYYQPEAYIPQTDTYIEKDASINEDLERFRLAASHALLGRRDTIIVASVSCIYGLLSPEDYRGLMISLREGQEIAREDLMAQLTEIQYTRNDYEPKPGVFRVRGDVLDIFPSYSTEGIRVSFFGDEIESLKSINAVTGRVAGSMPSCLLSPAKQFVMPKSQLMGGVERIKTELRERLAELDRDGRLLEGQRLRQRTEYDLAMLAEMGYCTGIENYSAPLAGRASGVPPPTLIDYFGGDFLCIIDESHVTLPQIRAMYNGDQARKQILVDNGFRLPSAKDNRPLTFQEFDERVGRILYVSATPGPHERAVSTLTAEQVIRPTGLLDPVVEVRPLAGQIDDLIEEIRANAERGGRTLVAALTKRACEDLSQYLADIGVRAEWLHSDIDAIGRVDILGRLQPPARGPRPPRGHPRGHPRRRQGGLPPLRDLPHPDRRPLRPQRRGQGHPLRRRRDPRHQGRPRGHPRAPRQAGGLQRRPRHRPQHRPPRHQRGPHRRGHPRRRRPPGARPATPRQRPPRPAQKARPRPPRRRGRPRQGGPPRGPRPPGGRDAPGRRGPRVRACSPPPRRAPRPPQGAQPLTPCGGDALARRARVWHNKDT